MKTLKVGIASYEDMKARTMAIARGELRPKPSDPKVWFTSPESFAKLLSNRNRALLAQIADTHPASLHELATTTGRTPGNLSRTLVWDLLRLSVPGGLATVAVMSGFLLFTKIVAGLDSTSASVMIHGVRVAANGAATTIIIEVLSATFFSCLAFGTATATLVGQSMGQGDSDLASEVKNELDQHNTFDDVLKVYDNATNKDLDAVFTKISEIHDVDVSLYDLDGNLRLASNKLVYNKGLLSEKMEPNAFYHLTRLRQIQHVQEEKIGTREFLSIYVPVRDERGAVYAYLNIPSFYSPDELNQEISNFLVTIINLNAFIFLIAGLIALLITNRITQSFSIISEKMKALKLGRNEEITWKRNDEIGDLVNEYNKMVKKLDESAQLLAKSEREGAWREMAKQVAHEIKNPLTPMKL